MTFMFKSWWKDGRMPHERMVAEFAKAGVTALESFHRDFIDDPALLTTYPVLLAGHGMRVAIVDVICNLVYATPEQRQQGRDELRRGLDVCVALGAEIAHVAGHRPVDGVPLADARAMIADGLAEAADFASRHGLTLAIEDFDPSPTLVCSAADCLDILTRAKGTVKFVFDTGNFEAVGEHADANLDRFYPHICNCHFKDFRRDPARDNRLTSCVLGQGLVPNAAVARELVRRHYAGWVALEAMPLGEDPVGTVRRDLPTLMGWFGER